MAVNSWDEIEKFRGNIVKGEWPTIPELYEMAVKRWPDHISFSVFEPEKKALTFAQAWEKIKKGAAYLRSKGIKKGDRVLLNGKNSPDWAIAYFAILYAGGVIVPIDNQMHVDRCMRLSEFAKVRFAIADFDILEKMKAIGGTWYDSLYGVAMLKGRDVGKQGGSAVVGDIVGLAAIQALLGCQRDGGRRGKVRLSQRQGDAARGLGGKPCKFPDSAPG